MISVRNNNTLLQNYQKQNGGYFQEERSGRF